MVNRIKNRKTDQQNPMQIGWKLEAVDLMDPKLICPATVTVSFTFLFFYLRRLIKPKVGEKSQRKLKRHFESLKIKLYYNILDKKKSTKYLDYRSRV